ncbi:MAG: glycosyltransferase family 39 protein [Patescibacteria group bacterium]|jgi:4-amino-4-deoxy-L-arabinose transferase-like glycosyltransferase|nr:glycosyltransferase family 39 protein [Patescibacteria group bacterium]
MLEFINKNRKIFLGLIILLAVFLIFFRLDRADMQTDDAINSFRAIGYLDFMDANTQTTPVDWFETIPWWSKLSFHDAPPLVFILQFLTFKLFGISTFAARLPFALAGLGSVILLYFVIKKLYNANIALLGSFILSILTYHIWASRVGYLEAVALFFILLTIYLFLLALNNPKYFILFGVSLGFTILTKYTTFFIIPVFFIYLFVVNKRLLINKYFIAAILLAALMFSPVIFYNFKVFQARGHFDLQFSRLLRQDISQDWPKFNDGQTDYAVNLIRVWDLREMVSLPLVILLVVCLIMIIYDSVLSWRNKKNFLLLLLLLFFTLEFSIIGTAVRFLSVIAPWVAMILALGIISGYDLFIKGTNYQNLKTSGLILILILIFGFELFFNINTNLVIKPFGERGKYYSVNRLANGGFNQLAEYLEANTDIASYSKTVINSRRDLVYSVSSLNGKDVYIFDPNLNWFSAKWYFSRWTVYHHILFTSATDLVASGVINEDNWFSFFGKLGVRNLYYLKGENDLLFTNHDLASPDQVSSANLAILFSRAGADTVSITNLAGDQAFEVYKLKLN